MKAKVRLWLIAGALVLGQAEVARGEAGSVVAAAGGTAVSGNVYLSFTVGEAAVVGGGAGNFRMTAGYQQPSSYDFWSTAQGLVSGPFGDPDGDGLSNFLEFAFGTNPLSAASAARPSGAFGPGGKFYLTVNKGTIAGDLLWSAEVSTDLATWGTPAVTVVLNDATTFSALYSGSSPKAFLRLRLGLLTAK